MADALELDDHFGNKQYNTQMIIIEADNPEKLYNALKNNVNVLDEPTVRQLWGIKCFQVTNPDDNIIEFYEGL